MSRGLCGTAHLLKVLLACPGSGKTPGQSGAAGLGLLHQQAATCTRRLTFVQHRAKDGQAVVDSGAVPPAAAELVLALLDADPDPLRHTGHDFHVVPAEAQLLGYQARDAGTEDGLHAQG